MKSSVVISIFDTRGVSKDGEMVYPRVARLKKIFKDVENVKLKVSFFSLNSKSDFLPEKVKNRVDMLLVHNNDAPQLSDDEMRSQFECGENCIVIRYTGGVITKNSTFWIYKALDSDGITSISIQDARSLIDWVLSSDHNGLPTILMPPIPHSTVTALAILCQAYLIASDENCLIEEDIRKDLLKSGWSPSTRCSNSRYYDEVNNAGFWKGFARDERLEVQQIIDELKLIQDESDSEVVKVFIGTLIDGKPVLNTLTVGRTYLDICAKLRKDYDN
jgi:hypothetical protein